MKPYSSIETVFTRDKKTNLLNFGDLRNPVNECVSKWTISEKIDGTNIRVIVTLAGIEIKGRTDKADLPKDLIAAIYGLFPSHEKLVEYFTSYRGKDLPPEWSVTFYGEGYGSGIQKGGHYRPDKSFRCFDLLLGESWWTSDENMRCVCGDLGIPTSPCLGFMDGGDFKHLEFSASLSDRWFESNGSMVAWNDSEQVTQPEGIVAKPTQVLFDTHGDRVMWKLTFREWK